VVDAHVHRQVDEAAFVVESDVAFVVGLDFDVAADGVLQGGEAGSAVGQIDDAEGGCPGRRARRARERVPHAVGEWCGQSSRFPSLVVLFGRLQAGEVELAGVGREGRGESVEGRFAGEGFGAGSEASFGEAVGEPGGERGGHAGVGVNLHPAEVGDGVAGGEVEVLVGGGVAGEGVGERVGVTADEVGADWCR
jgi:hypothetical protein